LRVVDSSMHGHIGYTQVMPLSQRREFMGSAKKCHITED